MKTVAVVPSFVEEETIRDTVSALRAIKSIDRIVVVDDASPDRTAALAEEAGAVVVANGRNHGKGDSLNRVLTNLDFDTLLLIDGDLGRHAAQAELLMEPVLRGDADMAIAAFGAPVKKGGFGLAQGLGRISIRRLTGRQMKSPLSGQRAMTRKAFRLLTPFAPGFGMEVAMTIDALMAGLRVVEVQTTMSHRETERDLAGFIHRGRQFLDILLAVAARAQVRS